MPNPIIHIEIQVKDANKSREWYANVFGWQTQYDENLNYVSFTTEEGHVGGGMNPTSDMSGTIPYIGTNDIPGMLAKVKAAGGEVMNDETPIPGFGSFALFKDLDGNVIGLFKAGDAAG